VTHPFHPRFGQELELDSYPQFPDEGWAFSHDKQGREFRIPDHWTSLIPPDPFVVISDGRSLFHVRDLLGLVRLIKDLEGKPRRSSQRKRRSDV